MKQEILDKLKELSACKRAIVWARQYETFQQAWNACERGDDLLWLVFRETEPGTAERAKACSVLSEVLGKWAWAARADAAGAATAAAWAAGAAAARAARAAGAAAWAATEAWAAADTAELSRIADFVRSHYPDAPLAEGGE